MLKRWCLPAMRHACGLIEELNQSILLNTQNLIFDRVHKIALPMEMSLGIANEFWSVQSTNTNVVFNHRVIARAIDLKQMVPIRMSRRKGSHLSHVNLNHRIVLTTDLIEVDQL